MGKYKYLANNIALFSISNFVSKILVFLLVPFYTNVLSTSDYGIADVMQTTLLLLVPALTINMGEAALRFGIERENDRGAILRIGLKYVLLASALVALICSIASVFFSGIVRFCLIMFIFLFLANSTYEFMILFFQGCDQVRIVVLGSVFSTLILLTSNLVFLLVIKIGLMGYLISQILAFSCSVCLMILLGKKYVPYINENCLDGSEANKSLEKELLDYGKPMIAYSTSSWINNAADRYLVSLIKGVSVNGIYGVAYKIPAILTVFQRIFAQAWQMSANKSYDDENSVEFFSTMYKIYNTFMLIGCSGLILLVKPVALFMFKKDFYAAWVFVPPLLISVVFGALTGFLGSICLAYKDSKAMGIATGIGAAVNIILNILLIPDFGAMGAAIATAISYFLMYFFAYRMVAKHIKLKVALFKDYIAYLIVVFEAILMCSENIFNLSVLIIYSICVLLIVIMLIMYYREVKEIIVKLLDKIRHKKSQTEE